MKDPLSGFRAAAWYMLGGLVGLVILAQILK